MYVPSPTLSMTYMDPDRRWYLQQPGLKFGGGLWARQGCVVNSRVVWAQVEICRTNSRRRPYFSMGAILDVVVPPWACGSAARQQQGTGHRSHVSCFGNTLDSKAA